MRSIKNKLLSMAACCFMTFGVHAATAEGSSGSWWDENPWADPDRGFNWYPDPKEEVKPAEKKKPQKPKTIYEMTNLDEIKKELDRLKAEAVVNPSEQNVLAFLRAQNFVMDKASLFADVSRRVVWANPDVNYSARSPTVNFARDKVKSRVEAKREQTLLALAETHAILFFARSDCDFCNDQAPILNAFSKQSGMSVLAISLDSKPIPMFPDAKPDNGISLVASNGKGIEVLPAIFLIERNTKKLLPLGSGVIASEELAERIRVLTTTKPGEEF